MLVPKHLFRPKEFPVNYIARERILDLFAQNKQAKLIFLEAPAGYGKTSAVAEFVQHSPDVAIWYPLEKLIDKGFLFFVWNLVQAIGLSFPEFGEKSVALLEGIEGVESIDKKAQHKILYQLVTEMLPLEQPVWIVLEDYHAIDHEELGEAVAFLLEYTPPNICFIVTSRQSPKWNEWSRWSSQNIVFCIQVDDLAFLPEESKALAQNMGVTMPETWLDEIYESVGGWPILHQILYQNLSQQDSTDLSQTLDWLAQPKEQIYEFLMSELLAKCSYQLQDFLCRTSILSEINPDICNFLLGISNAEQILDQLTAHLFISRVGHSFVHSHEIMAAFLQKVLLRQYNSQEIYNLYTHLGIYFESKEIWEEAIKYYVLGRQVKKAIQLIEGQANLLINTAQFTKLASWLKLIPSEYIENEPVLLICRGVVLADQRNKLAEQDFMKAINLSQTQQAVVIEAWARAESAWFTWSQGNSHLARKMAKQTLDTPNLPPWLQAKLHHYLSLPRFAIGMIKEAIANADAALSLLRLVAEKESYIVRARMLRHFCQFYLSVGQIRKGVDMIEESYDLAITFNIGDWAIAWTNNQRAEFYRHQGRFAEAHACLDEAEAVLDKYKRVDPKLIRLGESQSVLFNLLIYMRGNLYRDEYQYKEAEACYQDKLWEDGFMFAMRIVQPGYEVEGLVRAKETWEQEKDNTITIVRAKYQAMLAVAYLRVGNLAEATPHLEESTALHEDRDAVYYMASNKLYLAKIHFECGHVSKGQACLRFTFHEMAKGGYYNLDVWHPVFVAEMCAKAIEYDIEADFVEQLILKRLRLEHLNPLFPLMNSSNEQVRERVIVILEQMGNELQLKARQLLDSLDNDDIAYEHFLSWLNSGWLTSYGLIRLRQIIGWRELLSFLMWVRPATGGSYKEIAPDLVISQDTVKTQVRKVCQKLEDMGLTFDRARNVSILAYQWLIKEKIINPTKSSEV